MFFPPSPGYPLLGCSSAEPHSVSPGVRSAPVAEKSGRDTIGPRNHAAASLSPFGRMRRVECPTCGIKVERVPWAQGKSPMTTEYKWFLARWARRMCWKVAQRPQVPNGGLSTGRRSEAITLGNKRGLVLNWFVAEGRLSSGIVEGLSNKLELITRKSYGFRIQEAYETALYHHLGDLPEPEFAHEFC